ncbi:hypothetical protein ACE3G8_20330, partial [Vreelandella venusta]
STTALLLMEKNNFNPEVGCVFRHVTPYAWIDVQLSGVSSYAKGRFCCALNGMISLTLRLLYC